MEVSSAKLLSCFLFIEFNAIYSFIIEFNVMPAHLGGLEDFRLCHNKFFLIPPRVSQCSHHWQLIGGRCSIVPSFLLCWRRLIIPLFPPKNI